MTVDTMQCHNLDVKDKNDDESKPRLNKCIRFFADLIDRIINWFAKMQVIQQSA